MRPAHISSVSPSTATRTLPSLLWNTLRRLHTFTATAAVSVPKPPAAAAAASRGCCCSSCCAPLVLVGLVPLLPGAVARQ